MWNQESSYFLLVCTYGLGCKKDKDEISVSKLLTASVYY